MPRTPRGPPAALKAQTQPKARTRRLAACALVVVLVAAAWHFLRSDGQDASGARSVIVGDDEEFGWLGSADNTLADEEVCDVPRVPATSLTREDFESTYFNKKPVVLTGVLSKADRERWTWDSFGRRHGSAEVHMGASGVISQQDGRGYLGITLGEFFQSMRANTSSHSCPKTVNGTLGPQYIFDKSWLKTEPGVLKEVLAYYPDYVKHRFTAEDNEVLFIGPSCSGSQFHTHPSAFNILVHGRKRWFLYNKSVLPAFTYPVYLPVDLWYSNVLPTIPPGRRPLQCVQRPGDLFYVPDSMYHATLNIGETLGFGHKVQALEHMGPSSALYHGFMRNKSVPKDPETLLRLLDSTDHLQDSLQEPRLQQVEHMRANLLMSVLEKMSNPSSGYVGSPVMLSLVQKLGVVLTRLVATVNDSSDAYMHLANLEVRDPAGSLERALEYARTSVLLWPYQPTAQNLLSELAKRAADRAKVGEGRKALLAEASLAKRAAAETRQYHPSTRNIRAV